MKKYKVGDKFTHVRVEVDTDFGVKEQRVEDMTVIGVSSCYVCLDDATFSTLAIDKTFRACSSAPERISISEEKDERMFRLWGRFQIRIYSQMSLKRIENKINREFQAWLQKKIGAYGRAAKVTITLTPNEEVGSGSGE